MKYDEDCLMCSFPGMFTVHQAQVLFKPKRAWLTNQGWEQGVGGDWGVIAGLLPNFVQ